MSAEKYETSDLDGTIESGSRQKSLAVAKAEPTPGFWEDLYDDITSTASLWVVVPLVLLIEYGITVPLGVVHPDHELHMVTFCTGCNADSDTAWGALAVSDITCISDAILSVIGESFQGFVQNYLATMLGHICTVYALMAAQDADVRKTIGKRETLHIFAYAVLIIDMIVEVYLLNVIQLSDPDSLSMDGEYAGCNSDEVIEITDHKTELENFAQTVLIIRMVVAAFVTIIYVIKSTPTDEEKEEVEDKKKGK
jgi:hypothetical protein